MTFLLILSQLFCAPPIMPLSVATSDDALAMFYNPAGLSTNRGLNIYYVYKLENWKITENSSFAGQLGPLGFSWIPGSPFSYGLGLGFKLGSGAAFGVRYFHCLSNYWCLGTLIRPANSLSIGITWPDINYEDWHAIITGIGIRPFGNRLTLFAETRLDSVKKPWLGLQFQPVNGIELKGMANTDKSFSLGVDISFGNSGIGYTGSKLTNSSNSIKHSLYIRYNKDIRLSILPAESRFLTMKLSGLIQDAKPGFSLFGPTVTKTTYEILDLLHKVKEDKKMKGIILTSEYPQMSYAQTCEIRDALQEIKAKDKKVIVYAPHLSTKTYFLASVADLIVSHPLGEVNIPGMYSQVSFLKGTLGKLGIEAEYERVGKYKTAPEMLTEDSLSPSFREMENSMLDDRYGYFLEATAKARGFSKEELEKKVNYGFFSTDSAKIEGLIDTFAYSDQLDSLLETRFGKINKISERRYINQTIYKNDWEWREPSKIAVIYASGTITQGESGTDPLQGDMVMGANTICRAIKRTRNDKSVKAIVLRVDSPGGDGFASDLIWRELEITKKKKPVIVSMSTLAASGGYYISCNSDRIFALPTTLTASIGVFDLKLVTSGLYEKIGMKTEVLKRGEHADAQSEQRKFTDEERQMLKKSVEEFYAQFINKVANGRNKPYEYIDSIGQGRVWTGKQAKELGLVDSLAGFLTAIDYAKDKANVKEVEMVFLPKPRPFFFGSVLDWFWRMLTSPKFD